MGAYLSAPITEKVSSDQDAGHVAYGASSMQGWRMSQEDAHNCCVDFDQDASLFAVYDGHGGHDVAVYCSQNLPVFIKNTEAYKRGDVKQALIDAFLEFDATLATPKVINILKTIAKSNSEGQKKDSDDSDVEENVNNLYLEASMPLAQVMAQYKSEVVNLLVKSINEKSSDEPEAGSSSQQLNNDGGACSSSSAGCSSSTWDTNETDVSSSSQQCESSTSTADKNISQTPNSSEADQELDSTTSNGDVACSSQVGSSVDSEPTKASQMPDSSEDVDVNVSPSKVTNSTTSQNEAEVNGGTKNFRDADSSKNPNDNECSSSSSPVENGELSKLVTSGVSTSDKRLRRKAAIKTILDAMPLSSSDSDEDDDDENDENFVGQPEDSDDDDDGENDDNHLQGEENEDDSDDDELDDDDDDEDDEEDDDDEEEEIDTATDEPGIDSGCTAVVAILKGNELYVANAGDSRCVLCRDGEAVELSLDHKPEDQIEMERIVKAGGKVTGDGRVNGGLNLSRALGDHSYKKNQNLPPEEQMISALPDVKTVTLDREKDEFMVLACDGIWNSMSSQNVINFVRQRLQQASLSKICEELFDHCLAPNTIGDGTGCDNMTAIIVRFKSPSAGKEATPTEDDTLVTKKRPATSNDENDVAGTTEDKVVEDSKRMKMETC